MGIYDELTQLEDESPTPKEGITKKPTTGKEKTTPKVTQKSTRVRKPSSELPRTRPRDNSREKPRDLPTRDEIQEFSFRLRDELKVKVQAEVPHGWQKELEEMARKLDVKKLELYRFILGEFLGKVQRKKLA
jgi:hypothetical protein